MISGSSTLRLYSSLSGRSHPSTSDRFAAALFGVSLNARGKEPPKHAPPERHGSEDISFPDHRTFWIVIPCALAFGEAREFFLLSLVFIFVHLNARGRFRYSSSSGTVKPSRSSGCPEHASFVSAKRVGVIPHARHFDPSKGHWWPPAR